jgi:hypothetical protein
MLLSGTLTAQPFTEVWRRVSALSPTPIRWPVGSYTSAWMARLGSGWTSSSWTCKGGCFSGKSGAFFRAKKKFPSNCRPWPGEPTCCGCKWERSWGASGWRWSRRLARFCRYLPEHALVPAQVVLLFFRKPPAIFPMRTCFLLLLSLSLWACQPTAPPPNLTAKFDPFIGTGGCGHTYPGATLPFGMVQLSALLPG